MSGAKPGAGPERPKEETTEVPVLYKESGLAGLQQGNMPVSLGAVLQYSHHATRKYRERGS